jgi:transposase
MGLASASIQDRDGAPALLQLIRNAFPWLRHVFADGGYAGQKLKKALASIGCWTIEIVKRSDAAKGFKLLPRRWVVERPSHGSTAIVVWQKTSRPQLPAPKHGS